MLVWTKYLTDMGRAYPMFALSVRQENDRSTNFNGLDFLPNQDLPEIINLKNSCTIPGLTPRKIRVFTTDGAQFLLNYYQPFNQMLEDYLINNLDVQAYEWIGERIKYGRLKRMLENV